MTDIDPQKIYVCVPTRGLVYAETMRGILREMVREGVPTDHLLIGHPRPMPDCFNVLVEEALEKGATHIWFVEEDNEVPEGVLRAFITQNTMYLTMDYPVGKGVSHIHTDERGTILWTGLGCTFINANIFSGYLQAPWFRVDRRIDYTTGEVHMLGENAVNRGYGGHDVWFGHQLRSVGIPLQQVEGFKGKHFRAKEIQKQETNNGFYTITSL